MAGYIIAEVDVTDPVGYEEYRKLVASTIEQYNGRFLVRAGASETLEGDWAPNRLVVLEFPSVERAKEWWASEEYRQAKAIRQRTSTSRLVAVEGV